MNHLDPIVFHNNAYKSDQALNWAVKHNWSTTQTTHNIMYNIDALMNRSKDRIFYVFSDRSYLVETSTGELL